MALLIVAFETSDPPPDADTPDVARLVADCIRVGMVDPSKISVWGAYFELSGLPPELAREMDL